MKSIITRFFLFAVIAYIATSINYPLARFPWQDLIWNDLVLLSRTAFSSNALISNPFASIDFLQGLGSNIRADVKILFHPYDPAVIFSLVTHTFSALWLRTFFLIFFCIFCIEKLWRQHCKLSNISEQWNYAIIPILIFYILTPQFLFEVSNHFSAVFYTIPGMILGLRSFLLRPSLKTAIGYLFVSVLFVNLSDLHIFFIAPTLLIFLLLYDDIIRKANKNILLLAILSLLIVIALSFASILKIFIKDDTMVVANSTAMPLLEYLDSFLKHAAQTTIVPIFIGPVSIYIAPYLPVFALVILFSKKLRKAALNLRSLWLMILSLFIFGALLHGIDFFRERLPSLMRYHLAIIPFLCNIWCIYHLNQLSEIISVLKMNRKLLVRFCMICLAVFITLSFTHMGKHPESGDLFFNGFHLNPVHPIWKVCGQVALSLFPFLFILLLVFGTMFTFNNIRKTFYFLLIFILSTCLYFSARSFGLRFNDFTFIDKKFFHTLYIDFPASLNQIIDKSSYADSPRSFVPVAVCSENPQSDRGWNDKLLPMIEYPESLGGRSFFQWRYSYTLHTSLLYNEATHYGPINFFPPAPIYINNAIAFAEKTESPFIICADSAINNSNLELLGTYNINHELIKKNTKYNRGLIGNIYIFGIKSYLTGSKKQFEKVEYHRTYVQFSGIKSSESIIKLPITYFSDLTAQDEDGNKIILQKGDDDFVYIETNHSFDQIKISSFSWLSFVTLISPLGGFLPLLLILFKFVQNSEYDKTHL